MALLIDQAFVGGKWINGPGQRKRISVVNPYDNTIVGAVPDCGPKESQAAIQAAVAAQTTWAAESAKTRAAILIGMAAFLEQHLDAAAAILTAEQGKPLAEAIAEIRYGVGYLQFFAEEASRVDGEILSGPADRQIHATREPVGVCAAITPWNFPHAMLARKLAAALAAGCAMIAMPSHLTPLSALILAKAAEAAGLPAGVFSVVTGMPDRVAPTLMQHCEVRKLSFTGSVPVGKLLYRQSADTLKRLTLELGGNAPFVVFDDADLPAALDQLIACKFRNAGQTCICANRILVQRSIYPAFVDCLASRIRNLAIGNGADPQTQLGPLISRKQYDRAVDLYADAVAKGARAIVPLQANTLAPEAPGHTLMPPSLLADVTPAMRLWSEEIFAPIAAVRAFDDEADALAQANDATVGLAAYAFTRDHARCLRLQSGLAAGIVGINTAAVSLPEAPFGGIKDSGFGREGSRHGLHEYTQIKYTCISQ